MRYYVHKQWRSDRYVTVRNARHEDIACFFDRAAAEEFARDLERNGCVR
jgi:hypothetical protein